ncbi:hypothetical protein ACH5RR_002247 [Cinchona calisaya]|uniref:EF-hand domain-containing protein n=1 Tax=Cinchona calisaya TaxID=153742 RepID=A0ABD3B6D4_9GENT
MSRMSFLDVQYSLSKRKFFRIPSRMLSIDRQNFCIVPVYQQTVEEMRQVFNEYDINKDSKISKEEYKAILTALGKVDLLTEDVQKIFEVADLDGDRFIDFKEFVEVQ